jgi:hypothetical protein
MSDAAQNTLLACVAIGGLAVLAFIIGWLVGFHSCDQKWRSR